MEKERDYTSYSFRITLFVAAVLVCIGFVPGFRVAGHYVKRTNILSDVIRVEADDAKRYREDDPDPDALFLAERAALPVILPEGNPDETITYDWNLPGRSRRTAAGQRPAATATHTIRQAAPGSFVPIEDFGTDGGAMKPFFDALADKTGRPVRIGLLGDSFTEGDIITVDLREQLQTLYGGRGVGFVPFTSQVARYRGSVKHVFEKWKSFNLVQRNDAPEHLRDRFFISGYLCVPEEGATTTLEGVTFRKHLSEWSVARILFINERESKVEVTVNDTLQKTFSPAGSPRIQQIAVRGDRIRKVRVRVGEPEGFVGYGVVMEDEDGISVDSYSLRSNSGIVLFGTDPATNRQMDDLLGFDLLILQYGLNAMSPDILSYRKYGSQISQVIDYIKECFPGAAILVMGVGDRSTQEEGEFVTMPSVPGMVSAQREAARQSGVAFWNTFQAMGGPGGMVRYVEREWAAKDYTHIGYAGGRAIARELVKSLEQARYDALHRQHAQDSIRQAVDSAKQIRKIFYPAGDTAWVEQSGGNGQ